MNLRFMRGLLIIIPYLIDTFYLLCKITPVRKYVMSTSNLLKDKLLSKTLYKIKKDVK